MGFLPLISLGSLTLILGIAVVVWYGHYSSLKYAGCFYSISMKPHAGGSNRILKKHSVMKIHINIHYTSLRKIGQGGALV